MRHILRYAKQIDPNKHVCNVRKCLTPSKHTPTRRGFHHSQPHFKGNSPNTFLKMSRPLYRFTNRSRSLSRCAESLAWPTGKCAAGASNSFSKKRIAGIDPPSRMKRGLRRAAGAAVEVSEEDRRGCLVFSGLLVGEVREASLWEASVRGVKGCWVRLPFASTELVAVDGRLACPPK